MPASPATDARAWVFGLGYEAFEVGGAVRDRLLGIEPKDIDFMLLAMPAEIRSAVERSGGWADDLVVRDRVVGVRAHLPGVTPADGVEIAPPRVERSTGPGRHDFVIVPHPDLCGEYDRREVIEDDARRRDFTINALYRDGSGEVHDPLGRGLADLDAQLLRTTHEDSFRDDPLRILRAARFVARGFAVEDETYAQMVRHADAIDALTRRGVSGTARDELGKLLAGEQPGTALRLLRDTGALARVLPEFAPCIGFDQESRYHQLDCDEHIFRVVERVAVHDGSAEAHLAALFHDIGKPAVAFRGEDGRLHFYAAEANDKIDHADAGAELTRAAMNRLGYSTRTTSHVVTVVREHMVKDANKPTPVRARRMRARLSDAVIADVLMVRRADLRSKDAPGSPIETPGVDELERMVFEAAEQGAPRAVADLAIDGSDLHALGYGQGPAIGAALRGLLAEAIDQPKLNERDWLLKHATRRRPSLERAA